MVQGDLVQLASEALASMEVGGQSLPDLQNKSSFSKSLQFEKLNGGDCSEVYSLRFSDSFDAENSRLGVDKFCLKVLRGSEHLGDCNNLVQLHTEMLSLLALRAHFATVTQRIVPRVYCVRKNARLQVLLLEHLEREVLEQQCEYQDKYRGMSGLGRLLSKLHMSPASEIFLEQKVVRDFISELEDVRSYIHNDADLSESQLFTEFSSGANLGFYCDNFIGLTPQKNTVNRKYTPQEWPEFFAELRLLPMMERCGRKGLLQKKDFRSIEALCVRLVDILPRLERASLLHGDLWSGNVYWCGAEPVLIDPACYYGHYEVDLAMTQMFSGFSSEFYDSYYAEFATPNLGLREPGLAERFSIYNLYHLLNHLLLFGSSYYSGVWDTIKPWAT